MWLGDGEKLGSNSQREHMYKVMMIAWGLLILFFSEWKIEVQELWAVKVITILVTPLKQKLGFLTLVEYIQPTCM